MASLDPLHWTTYLDAALLAYRVIYHHIIGMFGFKALYGKEHHLNSNVFQISNVADSLSADIGLQLISNGLIRLQDLVADSLLKTGVKESDN